MYLEADTTPDVTNVYTATCTGAADLQWTNWQAGQAVCNHTFTALSSQYQSFNSYLVCISVIPPKEKRTSLLGRMASDQSKNLYLSYWDGNLGVLWCASWNISMPLLWPYLGHTLTRCITAAMHCIIFNTWYFSNKQSTYLLKMMPLYMYTVC